MRVLPPTLLLLVAALAGTAPASAQVKEAEPFGGRPFGAPPGPPPAAGSGMSQGTAMGAPGVSSVSAPGAPNLGTPMPAAVAAPVPVPVPAPAPAHAPVQVAPSQPVTGGTMPVTPSMNAPTAAMQVPGTTPAPPPANVPAPAPANASVPAPAPAPASVVPPFGVGQNPSRNAPPAVAASTAQQPPARGLPSDAPKLVISGSVYSPDPTKRLLIVNGQVMREGADLGQGVVLREVKQDSAVLGFRGSNYNVVF